MGPHDLEQPGVSLEESDTTLLILPLQPFLVMGLKVYTSIKANTFFSNLEFYSILKLLLSSK